MSSSDESFEPPPKPRERSVSLTINEFRMRRLSSTRSDLIQFEVECLKSVLQETVSKLIIANGGEKNQIPSGTKLPMKFRFKDSVREKLFHEETLEPIQEAMERMIFVKLGNDVARLRKILSDTLVDLEQTGDYQSLKILIDTEIRLEREEYNLIEQNLKCENLFKYWEKKFDDDNKDYKAKVKEIDDRISEIESELQDLQVENKIKLRLVEEWEKTRHSQIKFVTENKEKHLRITADNYKRDTTRELRVKFEIESFLQNQTKYFENLAQEWTKKYDTEVKLLDDQVNATKDKMLELKLKHDSLYDTFLNRQDEIDEYLEEKKIKNHAIEMAEKQWDAAVRIQSWWKGIMVRNGLGPYRRKGKGKTCKKSKKGKKNKQ